jgi:hypothetical protein
MTARGLLVTLALGLALDVTGCKSPPAHGPDAAPDGHPGASDAGPPVEAGHCVVGQSTIGDCAL